MMNITIWSRPRLQRTTVRRLTNRSLLSAYAKAQRLSRSFHSSRYRTEEDLPAIFSLQR